MAMSVCLSVHPFTLALTHACANRMIEFTTHSREQTNLPESSKEGGGFKRVVLPMIMMMMTWIWL
jgi:hypothetical protein